MQIESTIEEVDPYRGTSMKPVEYELTIKGVGTRAECKRVEAQVLGAFKG